MFVKLYLLGAALALMPLPIQPQGPHDKNLSLDVSENIDGPKFSVDLKVKKSSDIVMVKCSNDASPHGNTGYKFTTSKDVTKYKNLASSTTSKYIWVPVLKKSFNSTRFSCGEVTIKPGDVMSPMIGWTYNVKWNNGREDKTRINSNNMDYPLPETHSKCHNETENLLIVSRDKENDMAVIINPRDVKNPYPNQEFYYFIKPEENDGRQIIEYCGRYRGYRNSPHFNFPDHNDNSTINEVKKININESNYEKEEKIKVDLKLGDDIKFYRNEIISLSRMKYTENELIDIENSTQQINSSFVIKGFDLVKLVYNHLDATGYNEVSQVYYFGPASKNITIEKYYGNHEARYSNPNCSIYFMNVGYLDKVIYNGIEGSIDRSLDFISFERGYGCGCFCHRNLVCIYKTLDGTITISNKYDHQDIDVFHCNRLNNILSSEMKSDIFGISCIIFGASILFLIILMAVVITIVVKKRR
uniref:ZP domain-containing protein n=1 Tax=Strongyloides papillosus TaxID=174720 RepID=A0A0N5BN01_STREA